MPPVKLAWANLLHDRARLATTLVGITFSVFLMLYQGSLLLGFIRAASAVIDASGADLWIMGRAVTCFDFPAPLPERFGDIARGSPGVSAVRRAVTGNTQWHRPDGVRQTVLVVGADDGVGERFPLPRSNGPGTSMLPDAIVIDRSNARLLGVTGIPSDGELGDRRARVVAFADGFGSFLATPYVFTTHGDAIRYCRLASEYTSYILVWVQPGYGVDRVRRQIQARLPDGDVLTGREFARRSRLFWVIGTGAGGALFTAGLLGFIIGVVIVSQSMYATTMENLDEFATLKAMGASRGFILRIVLTQALLFGAAGCVLGIALAIPSVRLTERLFIPWIFTPRWFTPLVVAASLAMCGLASMVSIRKALSAEPARVFRA
jgi:putative ABC transport system permease protein